MAHILLADDDDTLRHFIKKALENDGHTVTDCQNGREALLHLQKKDVPDLLLTDIVMPGMDGFELSTHASKIVPHLKIMFITGFSGVNVDKAEGHKLVSKPFHLKDIVTQVNQTLNGNAN